MKLQEFLEQIKETIDTETNLTLDTKLEEIEEYDSVAFLSLMNLFDELEIELNPDDFDNIIYVKDLVNLAKDKIDDYS